MGCINSQFWDRQLWLEQRIHLINIPSFCEVWHGYVCSCFYIYTCMCQGNAYYIYMKIHMHTVHTCSVFNVLCTVPERTVRFLVCLFFTSNFGHVLLSYSLAPVSFVVHSWSQKVTNNQRVDLLLQANSLYYAILLVSHHWTLSHVCWCISENTRLVLMFWAYISFQEVLLCNW